MTHYIIYTTATFMLLSLAVYNICVWRCSIKHLSSRVNDVDRILVPTCESKIHKYHTYYHPDAINKVNDRLSKGLHVVPSPYIPAERAYIKDQKFFVDYILRPITTINISAFMLSNLSLLPLLLIDLSSWYTTATNLSLAAIIGLSSLYGCSQHKKYFGDVLSNEYIPKKETYRYVQYLYEEFNDK